MGEKAEKYVRFSHTESLERIQSKRRERMSSLRKGRNSETKGCRVEVQTKQFSRGQIESFTQTYGLNPEDRGQSVNELHLGCDVIRDSFKRPLWAH